MLFQILNVFAMLLMLLPGAAATTCDNGDTSWSDLGDDNAIETAFKDFCYHLDFVCHDTCEFSDCLNVGEDHIYGMVTLDKKINKPRELCEYILDKVKKDCAHGGTDPFIVETIVGGHFIRARGNITVHPGRNNC